ncbi:hypothetical protein IQ251_15915 [Saccharopolyspora sp. HNM0983]|uniref:Uncharacterized protein n=1 Tax=Saccharopolyspora montiporae TaxID=2781240 RepID=A0A929G1K5_9PSEU|nr:hypothetical protein [Saccharopolyspora sp. HNM0983]MBE9375937.1 hypothetical protein [Saccharopolyspora sp. HNM0983]
MSGRVALPGAAEQPPTTVPDHANRAAPARVRPGAGSGQHDRNPSDEELLGLAQARVAVRSGGGSAARAIGAEVLRACPPGEEGPG